jgi:para-aminobenzoate synthetase component 1
MTFRTISKINEYAQMHVPFLLLVDFDRQKPVIFTEDELLNENIFFKTSLKEVSPPVSPLPDKVSFEKDPVSYNDYKKGFDNVQGHINNGDTFLLNLTFPTTLKSNLSLRNIYEHSKAKYKLLYKDEFVCFSPETFIRITDNIITSAPMKGTIDAAEEAARQKIISDVKETAEHNTIVDLIRNDLNMVASNVKVSRYRYIDEIKTNDKTLLQVSSEISGELPTEFRKNLGEIIFRLLPAGSISGAPKEKTVEIIHDSEIDRRGYYTGIFVWFDGHNLDSAVMIRYIEQKNNRLMYRSGGGITTMSNPEDEYQELLNKVYVPFT